MDFNIFLSGKQKMELQKTISLIKNDKDYREYLIQFLDEPFRYTQVEKLAVEATNISDDGKEIVDNDFSNYYDDYNEIKIDTDEDVKITCMNIAIGYFIANLLGIVSNHLKFKKYDVEGIAKRQKGCLIASKDKSTLIKLISDYNKTHPDYFVKKAERYYNRYIIEEDSEWLKSLATEWNTNIYLYELNLNNVKNDVYQNPYTNDILIDNENSEINNDSKNDEKLKSLKLIKKI